MKKIPYLIFKNNMNQFNLEFLGILLTSDFELMVLRRRIKQQEFQWNYRIIIYPFSSIANISPNLMTIVSEDWSNIRNAYLTHSQYRLIERIRLGAY